MRSINRNLLGGLVASCLLAVAPTQALIIVGGNATSPPTGDLPSFSLENPSASVATGAHMLRKQEWLTQGALPSGRILQASLAGVGNINTQTDIKQVWGDGSAKEVIVTMAAPSITTSTTKTGSYTAVNPSGSAVDIATLPASGYTLTAVITIGASSPTGTPGTYTYDLVKASGSILAADLAAKATFTGSISGNTLTTSAESGTIAIGHWLTGTGVPSGTLITAGSGHSWTIGGPSLGTINSEAMSSAPYTGWVSGPQGTEVRVERAVTSSLRLVADIIYHADGSVRADVQVNNDRTLTNSAGEVHYSYTLTQNGTPVTTYATHSFTGSITSGVLTAPTGLQVGSHIISGAPAGTYITQDLGGGTYQLNLGVYAGGNVASTTMQTPGVTQNIYQKRHDVVWSNGAPKHNIIHDVAYLEKMGIVPSYDLAYPTTQSSIVNNTLAAYVTAMAAADWGGALPVNGVSEDMPGGGARPDLGITTDASALWLMTMKQTAAQYALGWADAGGSVPWHFYDPATGNQLSVLQYPALWTDNRGGNGPPGGLTQYSDATQVGWRPENAHLPSLSYVPYILTGDRYYLDNLNGQATQAILGLYPPSRSGLGGGTTGDIAINEAEQERAQAWCLRDLSQAALANPDSSAEKVKFTQVVNDNWAYILSRLSALTAAQGEAYGFIPSSGIFSFAEISPWMQDYLASVTVQAAQQGNTSAQTFVAWQAHWSVGRFLPHSGWDLHDGAAFRQDVYNLGLSSYYQTWADIDTATNAAGNGNGSGWAVGDYAELALHNLAGMITILGSTHPDAMHAYAWLLTSGAAFLLSDPRYQLKPRMPDGNFIYSSQIQTDTSNTNVTLTSSGGTSLLSVSGTGSDTLVGGTGMDILYCGTRGNNTCQAGTGNQYLFGYLDTGTACTGTTLFRDNTGNNLFAGSTICTGANTYEFGGISASNSGQDVIGYYDVAGILRNEFRAGTDFFKIKTTLDGHNFASAAEFLATGTTVSGSCVFTLGGGNTIKTQGVDCASIGAYPDHVTLF